MTPDRPEEMIVSTHLEWVWRDVSAGVAQRWPVRRDHGAAVPAVTRPRTAWWVATAHAARLLEAGVRLELECTPAGWVAALPHELTKRRVHVTTVGEALRHDGDVPARGFVKPSRAKLAELPAGWYDDVPGALTAAAAEGVAHDTVLEVTADRLRLEVEWRSFVLDGDAGRPSPYLIRGKSWEPDFDARQDVDTGSAHAFAREVAAELHRQGSTPNAWVLDVAEDHNGEMLVVESNAAWASGAYGCGLRRVADAAAAASTPPADRRFLWTPDATEAAHARRNPLPPSRDARSRGSETPR